MPAIFTKGDLFHTDGLRAYAFGSNAKGTMDGGIALAMQKRWPKLAEALKARAAEASKLAPGEVFAYSENDETVYALILQEDPSKKAKLAALTRSVSQMLELAAQANVERVGVSHPGTGKAGLEWPRVKRILQELGEGTAITLVVFEQFVRAKVAGG